MTDQFTPYETGLAKLLSQLDKDDPNYPEALVCQQRLIENITDTRAHGDTATLRHERSRIIHALNPIAQAALGKPFIDLCAGLPPPQPSPLEAYLTALHEYCTNLPYLSLYGLHSPHSQEKHYVPLKLRAQSRWDTRASAAQESWRDQLSIVQVLGNYERPHILILGEPGAGKSMLLRHIAEHAWDAPEKIGLATPYLPILVPLRRLVGWGSLEARLSQALMAELPLIQDLPSNFFIDWPAQTGARWLFLLDALDEVPTQDKPGLMQWLRGVLKSDTHHRVLLTSRPSGLGREDFDPQQFNHYELLPFDPEQTGEFARRWFGSEAVAFEQELERVRAGELSDTPLLLTIAAQVYRKDKKLPERRSQLYEQFVDIWLNEARQRGLEDQVGKQVYDVTKPVLAHLASAMFNQPDQISEEVLNQAAAKALKKMLKLSDRVAKARGTKFVEEMGQRSGVFSGWGGVYHFVHPTFRDYLVAYDLVEDPKSIFYETGPTVFFKTRWSEKIWRETLLFVLCLLSDRNEDVSELLQPILVASNNLDFTAPALAEGINVSPELSHYIVDRLLDLARLSRGWKAESAFTTLGRLYDNEHAVWGLLHLAHDVTVERWRVLRASKALEQLGRTDSLMTLARSTSQGEQGRLQAAEALKDVGQLNKAAQSYLAVACDGDLDHLVRKQALGALKELERVDVLLTLIHDQSVDVWLRLEAIQNLGKLYRADDLAALAQDATVGVRLRGAAAQALGESGQLDQAIAILQTLSRDPVLDTDVRLDIAEAFVALDQADKAIPILTTLVEDTAVAAYLRADAAEVLGKLGRVDRAMPILLELAQDTTVSTNIRERAGFILWKLQCKDEAAQACLALVHDPAATAEVRLEAAEALEVLGQTDKASLAYLTLARDPKLDSNLRLDVAEVLGRLDKKDDAASILLPLAQGARFATDIRIRAAEILGGWGHNRAAALAYLELAGDKTLDAGLRLNAVEVLRKLGRADDAAATLLTLAHDESLDYWTRMQTAGMLKRLGRRKDLLALARAESVDVGIRMEAARAMGELGQADDLLALAGEEALDAALRVSAAEALGRLGRTDISTPILLALAQETAMSSDVRERAIWTLWQLHREDETLQACLTLARDPGVPASLRVDAAQTLNKLGQADQAALAYLTLIRDPTLDASVRVEVAKTLGDLGWTDEAATNLCALITDRTADASTREQAIKALGRMKRSEDLLALARRAALPAEMRVFTVFTLWETHDEDGTAQACIALARDTALDTTIRLDAADTLVRLGRVGQASHAYAALDGDPDLSSSDRRQVVAALRQLHDARSE